MQHDSRTISEIVENPEPTDDVTEDEEQLETAQASVTDGAFGTQPSDLSYALRFAKPIQQAREDANIPPQVSIKDLEGKTFVIASKVAIKAFLPQDGTQRDGWQCLCIDVETQKGFTVWIGQVVLKRDLETLQLPIRVTLGKRGRVWKFS